jgi:hypothetical protein
MAQPHFPANREIEMVLVSNLSTSMDEDEDREWMCCEVPSVICLNKEWN